MKVLLILLFSTLSLLASQPETTRFKEMRTLITVTQQLREQSEQFLIQKEADTPAQHETLDTLYQQQQRCIRQLGSHRELAGEMKLLHRYTSALYNELPDLDSHTVFQAYSLLIHRMIKDTARIDDSFDPQKTRLLALEEDLLRLRTLERCRETLAYDRLQYHELFHNTLEDLSDRALTLRKMQRDDQKHLGETIADYTAYTEELCDQNTPEAALRQTSDKAAALTATIRKLLNAPSPEDSAVHFSLH